MAGTSVTGQEGVTRDVAVASAEARRVIEEASLAEGVMPSTAMGRAR